MTAFLRVTDSVNTVTLSETDAWLGGWDPAFVAGEQDIVTESIDVTFIGGNTTVAANMEKLNLLFQQARQYAMNSYGVLPVYLVVSKDGSTEHQSLIHDGVIDCGPDWYRHERANGERSATLTIQRDGWWNGSGVSLVVDNGNTNDNIYNANDGIAASGDTRKAYVSISAAQITGEIDTPLEFQLQQISAHSAKRIWVANQVLENASFSPVMEMESCTEGSQVPGSSDTTLYSAGYARSLTLTTSLAKIASRAISNLAYFNYNQFNILAVFGEAAGSVNTDVVLQVRLTGASGTPTFYEGPLKYCTTDLVQWLDCIKLPPARMVGTGLDTIELHLYGKRTNTGTALIIDQLWFLPTYGFRQYDFLNNGVLAQNERLVDKVIPDVRYVVDVGGSYHSYRVQSIGDFVKLCPGKDNKLWVIRDYGSTLEPGATARFVIDTTIIYPRYKNL